MCVIIVKHNDRIIKHSTLVASAAKNPDGLGILWLDNYKLEKIPSENYKKLLTKRPFIAHFRFATVGKVNLKNCHPFSIDEDNLLFQNGTVPGLGNKVKTDTQHLAEILSRSNSKDWAGILEMTDCRYVIANQKDETYKIYNPKMWHYDEQGILYSKSNVLNLELVAVYGTLKVKGSNYYSYLLNSTHVGSGYTKDCYPLIVEGLPYLLSKKGKGHNVDVDVFLVNKNTMISLDILEGHPQWYKREKITISLNSNQEVKAWIYFNDTVQDTGKYHKSFEIVETNYFGSKGDTGYSYYDKYDTYDYYDINPSQVVADDDSLPMGCRTTRDKCIKCNDTLIYDEYESTHWCYTCDDYVDIPDSDQHNDIEDENKVKLPF
jgi:gamma-glutamylaminecyclotransferase